MTEPLEAPTKANSKIEELLQKFLAKGERPPSYTEAMIKKNKLLFTLISLITVEVGINVEGRQKLPNH